MTLFDTYFKCYNSFVEEEIVEYQNDETQILAERNVALSYEFAETLNLQVIKDQLTLIEKILLNQGIYIQEFIDR